MPTKHIPEDAWVALVMRHDGDTTQAREDVKRAVCEEAGVEYEAPEEDA